MADKAGGILDTIKDLITRTKGLDDIHDDIVVSNTSCTVAGTIVEDGSSGTPCLTSVVSSDTANTFGAWTEIDASVSADSWIKSITITPHWANPAADDILKICIEIGTGAGASETTKIRHTLAMVVWFDDAVGYAFVPAMIINLPIPIKVASGTRIAARVSDEKAAAFTYWIGVQYYQGLET